MPIHTRLIANSCALLLGATAIAAHAGYAPPPGSGISENVFRFYTTMAGPYANPAGNAPGVADTPYTIYKLPGQNTGETRYSWSELVRNGLALGSTNFIVLGNDVVEDSEVNWWNPVTKRVSFSSIHDRYNYTAYSYPATSANYFVGALNGQPIAPGGYADPWVLFARDDQLFYFSNSTQGGDVYGSFDRYYTAGGHAATFPNYTYLSGGPLNGLYLSSPEVVGQLIGAEDALLYFLIDYDHDGKGDDLVTYFIDTGTYNSLNGVMRNYTFKFSNFSGTNDITKNERLNALGAQLLNGRTLRELIDGKVKGSDGVTPMLYMGIGAYGQIYVVDAAPNICVPVPKPLP